MSLLQEIGSTKASGPRRLRIRRSDSCGPEQGRDGLHLIVTSHFQALPDEVPAKDMARYLANLARARKLVGYEFLHGAVRRQAAPAARRRAWIG
ncbi:hypothetical protein [Rhodanobacter lindaniclasticus]